MQGGTMSINWQLRMVAAQHGIWSGAELRRQLKSKAGKDLSPPSISALMTKEPREIRFDTLEALCKTLECTPNDLLWGDVED